MPPLQTYTYIAVTGKVIARTIQHNPPEQSKQSNQSRQASSAASSSTGPGRSQDKKGTRNASSAASLSAGPGSASGKIVPTTPKLKGKIKAGEEDEAEEDEGAAEEEENEELLEGKNRRLDTEHWRQGQTT